MDPTHQWRKILWPNPTQPNSDPRQLCTLSSAQPLGFSNVNYTNRVLFSHTVVYTQYTLYVTMSGFSEWEVQDPEGQDSLPAPVFTAVPLDQNHADVTDSWLMRTIGKLAKYRPNFARACKTVSFAVKNPWHILHYTPENWSSPEGRLVLSA